MKLAVPRYSQHAENVPLDWRKRSCGIVALKMALDYFGIGENVSVAEMIHDGVKLGGYIDGVGWRHDTLVRLAEGIGARVWREEFKNNINAGVVELKNKLKNGVVPIVSVATNHADASTYHLVTLIGYEDSDSKDVGDGNFYYNDPANKKGEESRVSTSDFARSWRGLVVFVST